MCVTCSGKFYLRLLNHYVGAGKYHCTRTSDLLFYWFGFNTTIKCARNFNIQNSLIQTSKAGGQPNCDTYPS